MAPLAIETIDRFRFDTAIISGCGFSLRDGLTAYDMDDAAVKGAAIRSSSRAILLCDEAKWGEQTFVRAAATKRLHHHHHGPSAHGGRNTNRRRPGSGRHHDMTQQSQALEPSRLRLARTAVISAFTLNGILVAMWAVSIPTAQLEPGSITASWGACFS